MLHVILIILLISLFYLSIANRMTTYINVLALQGVLLFFAAFFELKSVTTLNLILVLLETIVFKAMAVPAFFEIRAETKSYHPRSGAFRTEFRVVDYYDSHYWYHHHTFQLHGRSQLRQNVLCCGAFHVIFRFIYYCFTPQDYYSRDGLCDY